MPAWTSKANGILDLVLILRSFIFGLSYMHRLIGCKKP